MKVNPLVVICWNMPWFLFLQLSLSIAFLGGFLGESSYIYMYHLHLLYNTLIFIKPNLITPVIFHALCIRLHFLFIYLVIYPGVAQSGSSLNTDALISIIIGSIFGALIILLLSFLLFLHWHRQHQNGGYQTSISTEHTRFGKSYGTHCSARQDVPSQFPFEHQPVTN